MFGTPRKCSDADEWNSCQIFVAYATKVWQLVNLPAAIKVTSCAPSDGGDEVQLFVDARLLDPLSPGRVALTFRELIRRLEWGARLHLTRR